MSKVKGKVKVKLTILCENTAAFASNTLGEHGFSVFIETEHGNYLFDTGQGDTLIHNALSLKKDLRKISKVFLSHSHYDHTGGLLPFLNVVPGIEVIGHPNVFTDRYIKRPSGEINYIGIPYRRALLEGMGARFILHKTFQEVGPDIFLTGEIPRTTAFEKGDNHLLVKQGDGYIPDPFLDDQSVIVDTPKGLTIILGCAHAGVVNTINYTIDRTGKDKIYAVIGGMHLVSSTPNQIAQTIKALKEFEIGRLGGCHCTGPNASHALASAFGDRFFFANVGTVIEA